MAKHKDHYDIPYAYEMAHKFSSVYPEFNTTKFISLLEPTLNQLEFNDRQELFANAIKTCIPLSYKDTIALFYKILGPELKISTGMFTEGYWLWPISRYVELFGAEDFDTSTAFCIELTKRFTSEYAMRPVILAHPEASMDILMTWSLDSNARVRRMASECIRIRLPWAKKMNTALIYFESYKIILTNLKDDTDKTIQKSVANNLNDLYKEDVDKFNEIVESWQQEDMSDACKWIIKHGSRTMNKKAQL